MSDQALRRKRISGSSVDDQRSRFERDRDRTLYTQAFRRLSGVTQVVRVSESYTYHDRLSHSLKVAQIGRRLAEYFNMSEGPHIPDDISIDPDVVETAALAHDIGHPPFGHAAEQELNKKITQEHGIQDGFEGNAQSFRTVTRLCIQHSLDHGLDLTLASLNAILKYPWRRGNSENDWGIDESTKWGVYKSDRDAFDEVRQLSSVEKRRSPEADLMDWADDLAYAVHDMEDFYRAGIIPLDQLLTKGTSKEKDEFAGNWASANNATTEEGKDILKYIGDIARDTLRTPYGGTRTEQLDLNELSSKLIGRYIGSEAGGLKLQSHNDMYNFLQVEDYLKNEVSLLKHMTKYYVITNNSLATQQRGQREVISDLFDIFFKSTIPNSKSVSENANIILNRFQDQARELQKDGDEESRVRFSSDVICSLTEKQATQLHKRLTGDAPGSLQDSILR